MFSRLFEGSSWAGIAAVIHAVAALVATQGTDAAAWGTLAAGVAAIIIPDRKGD
jgi:hypothetical protein